jgi:hypothetical protein
MPSALFPSTGEMSERMQAFDWGDLPLGRPEEWCSALHTALGIILSSQQPMIIFWGAEYRCFYNDA